MKSFILFGSIFCLSFAGAFSQEVPISEFQQEMINDEPVTIFFDQGDVLTFSIDLSGDVISLVGPGSLQIQVKEPFYIKITEKDDLTFSKDKKKWKSFGEFFGGELSAELSEHPSIRFKLQYK